MEHSAEVHVDLLRPPVPGDQVQDLLGVKELRHGDDVALEAVQLAVGGGQVDQALLLRNKYLIPPRISHLLQPTLAPFWICLKGNSSFLALKFI